MGVAKQLLLRKDKIWFCCWLWFSLATSEYSVFLRIVNITRMWSRTRLKINIMLLYNVSRLFRSEPFMSHHITWWYRDIRNPISSGDNQLQLLYLPGAWSKLCICRNHSDRSITYITAYAQFHHRVPSKWVPNKQTDTVNRKPIGLCGFLGYWCCFS